MVHFNGERLKLYDNNHLTVVDAALTAGFPNDALFPKRGTPINFTVNGAQRIARGEAGDSAVVTLNGEPANINTPLEPNCEITITPSSAGSDAVYTVGQLEEYRNSSMSFVVNGKRVTCPKFVEVNGILEPESYRIKEGDKERLQKFRGVVIQIKGADPFTRTFTVRKVSGGIGVERIFPYQSPFIDSIEVNKIGKVRRARIFYLRDLSGKKARIKEKVK